MNINDLLHMMIEKRASDMHLKEGRPPLIRVDGNILPLDDMEILSRQDMKEMMYALMDDKQRKKFEETNEMDLAYNLEGVARFRANAFQQMGKYEIVLRAIPIKIPSIEEMNLPAALSDIALLNRGLVLVTGTTGSGKSTTLASMINKINETYRHHIVTIEDPIEFVHSDKKSSVSQREVGLDTENFRTALKYVLRQDPDVILIGEMRDAETVGIAVSAAETGHMVFSTLHTIDTIQTISRILDFFPKDQQAQVRVQLAGALKAVISLRLIARVDATGRVPAVEVLVVTPTVRGYMEEGKLGAIKDLIKDGSQSGMQTFDQSLISLYKKGLITIEDAKKNATSPQEIELMLKGITSSRASAQSILDSMLKEQGRKDLAAEIKAAKELSARGLIKESFAIFEKLREKYPDDREVGENLEALRNRLSSDQNSQDVRNMIMEGLNIYKKGNIKGAVVKWQEGLSLDPNNAQIKAYIKSAEEKITIAASLPNIIAEGVAIYKTGRIEEAIEKWREAIKLDQGNVQARSYIEGAEQKLRELTLKKETDAMFRSGQEEMSQGNDLEALLLFSHALNLKPDSREIKAAMDESYAKLAREDFGKDVEAALASEAFIKGINKLLEEDYMSTLKEWKKVVEKRPLETKLKDYMEKVKKILKVRMEDLMEKVDESYRTKKMADAMVYLNRILHIDPANEFALKYMRDLKPLFDEEASGLYREAMDLFGESKLKESREKLLAVLRIDPNHLTARKRLEEVNERLSASR
jgi:twitching motility protein PilT